MSIFLIDNPYCILRQRLSFCHAPPKHKILRSIVDQKMRERERESRSIKRVKRKSFK